MKLENIDQKVYGGVNPSKALNNIKKRYEERKKGIKSDLKTALVLQGGAMRGIFGAGVCCALQELGYTEGFDELYGASAGALNGAYFLSGQALYGATIYYQNINNRHFINFFRFRKIVDIDFLMDIIRRAKPLNTKRILNSSTGFNIILTEVSSGKAVIFKKGEFNNGDLLKVLKATAAMPFAYNIPVNIQGIDYLDGGVSCPLPIIEAISNGCTDILVVLTRPKSYKPTRPKGILHRYLIEPRMQKHSKNFYEVYTKRDKAYAEQLSIIMGDKKYRKKKVNIAAIFPEESLKIGRTTKNRKILKDTASQGAVKTLQLFGADIYHHKELFKFLKY
ncbi:MAG: patatin family protein [Candidatus Aerophobetes bacterium]|nr:patatin family protein [Candidatus Aerophobetes bacterium]